jgi:hypothetical protein
MGCNVQQKKNLNPNLTLPLTVAISRYKQKIAKKKNERKDKLFRVKKMNNSLIIG